MRLGRVNTHLRKKLKDPYFRKLYELEQQKLRIVKCIIDYRIKNKMSQKRLAENVGVTQQHISKIENGVFSSVNTLEKVLLYIGFTVQIRAIPLAKKVAQAIRKYKKLQAA